MGDLTRNLSRHEFACRCRCGFDTVDYELVIVIQDVCDHFKQSVTISGPNRCPQHNKDEGGSEKSEHVNAKAADIKIRNTHPDLVADYLEKKYSDKYGVGRYNGRTHIDVRPAKARWDMR